MSLQNRRTPTAPYRAPHHHQHQQLNPNARYTQSRTWHSPTSKGTRSHRQLNESRKRVCAKSPIWHEDFDLQQHRNEWRAGELRRAQVIKGGVKKEEKKHDELHEPDIPARPMRAPFDGRTFVGAKGEKFETNYGPVIYQQTIFCPDWLNGKEDVAPWPGKHEVEYEGDGRIATDRLHRRFLPLPRVGGNDTINWQHRAYIDPYPLENYYQYVPRVWYNPLRIHWEDIVFRMQVVSEREFVDEKGEDDEDGKHAVGEELMGLLDPKDQWV